MQGHIRKYKDRWAAIIYLGKNDKGKKEYKWIYDKDKKELQKKMNEFIYKYDKGLYIKPTKITLKKYCEDWLEYREKVDNIAEASVTTYKSTTMLFDPLWNKEMSKITVKDIDDHYLYLVEKGTSIANINKVNSLLYTIFKSAYRKQEIERNIMDFVTPPKKADTFEPTIIDNDTFLKTLVATKGSYLEMVVVLCGGLGLRIAEALGVQKSNIDFDNGFLYVRNQLKRHNGKLSLITRMKTKNSKRNVAMPPDFANMIKSYIKTQEKKVKEFEKYTGKIYSNNDMLICRDDGTSMSPQTVERAWRKLLLENNIAHYRIHDLRHFNATLMLENKLPEKFAREQLGHTNLKMTDKYQHIRKDFAKENAAKISLSLLKEHENVS